MIQDEESNTEKESKPHQMLRQIEEYVHLKETLEDHTCVFIKPYQSRFQPWYGHDTLQSCIGFDDFVAQEVKGSCALTVAKVSETFEKLAKSWKFKFKNMFEKGKFPGDLFLFAEEPWEEAANPREVTQMGIILSHESLFLSHGFVVVMFTRTLKLRLCLLIMMKSYHYQLLKTTLLQIQDQLAEESTDKTEEKCLLCLSWSERVWEPGGLPTKAALCNCPEKFQNHGDMLELVPKLQGISLQRKTGEGMMNVSTQLDQLVVCPNIAIETWLEIFGCLVKQTNRVWERGAFLATHVYKKWTNRKELLVVGLRHLTLGDMRFHLKHKWRSRLKMVMLLEHRWSIPTFGLFDGLHAAGIFPRIEARHIGITMLKQWLLQVLFQQGKQGTERLLLPLKATTDLGHVLLQKMTVQWVRRWETRALYHNYANGTKKLKLLITSGVDWQRLIVWLDIHSHENESQEKVGFSEVSNGSRKTACESENKRLMDSKDSIKRAAAIWEACHLQEIGYGKIRLQLLLASETCSKGYKEDSWLFMQTILKELRTGGFGRKTWTFVWLNELITAIDATRKYLDHVHKLQDTTHHIISDGDLILNDLSRVYGADPRPATAFEFIYVQPHLVYFPCSPDDNVRAHGLIPIKKIFPSYYKGFSKALVQWKEHPPPEQAHWTFLSGLHDLFKFSSLRTRMLRTGEYCYRKSLFSIWFNQSRFNDFIYVFRFVHSV